MKNIIGKLFCFITILLVTSNVAFSFGTTSSFPKSTFHNNSTPRTAIQKQKEIHTDDQSNVHYDFLIEEDAFENDNFEDLEIISDLPEVFSFYFSFPIKTSALSTNYKPYYEHVVKVPRWLWVRHIII
ncbi:MAG: hypothetical protein RI922_422 [Bacteroidota bacterium]|jgi:hypothetical protein